MNGASNYLALKTPDGFIQIHTNKVTHLLLEDSKIKIYLINGDCKMICESMRNLDYIFQKHGFVRVHSNCIVNFYQEMHLSLKDRTLTLSNKEKVIVGRNRIKTVKDILLKLIDENKMIDSREI